MSPEAYLDRCPRCYPAARLMTVQRATATAKRHWRCDDCGAARNLLSRRAIPFVRAFAWATLASL